jgi:hypothetical protein
MGRLAGRRPARGAFHGGLDLGTRQGAGRALVEGHDDIGAELRLDVHRQLGREDVPRAVVHRGELHAVVTHDAGALEAEHLKAAGVGQDRPVPAHEAVQAAVRGDELGAGTEIQVIRIGENDPGAELGELARRHRLDRRLGAYGHETGRLYLAVRRRQARDPRSPVARLHLEREAPRCHCSAHSANIASPKL